MDTTTEDPQVAYVVEAPIAGWLHLPSLREKLLPLAIAAGHEKLCLTCECAGSHPSDYTYTAFATGGPSGHREYIGLFTAGGGYSWHDFERVLTDKLTQQQAYLTTKATLAHV